MRCSAGTETSWQEMVDRHMRADRGVIVVFHLLLVWCVFGGMLVADSSAADSPNPADSAQPADSPSSVNSVQQADSPNPADSAQPADSPNPADFPNVMEAPTTLDVGTSEGVPDSSRGTGVPEVLDAVRMRETSRLGRTELSVESPIVITPARPVTGSLGTKYLTNYLINQTPGAYAAIGDSMPATAAYRFRWRKMTGTEVAITGAAMGATLGSCVGAFGASFGWWSEEDALRMVGAMSAAGALWTWSKKSDEGLRIRVTADDEGR